MGGLLLLVVLFLAQRSHCKINGSVIPVAYSPALGVSQQQLSSRYLKGVPVDVSEFKWPPSSTGTEVYRVAVGDFDYYFGLNTTEEGVGYFITGTPPPRRTNTSNWLRIAPHLSDLAPIVKELAERSLVTEECVFISDASSECRELRELTSPSFKWSVLTSVDSSRLADELHQLKSYVSEKAVHYALCDGDVNSTFSEQVLTKLLETGLYFGSEIYIYTKRNMANNGTQEVFKSFADAGADLAVISPVLTCSTSAPVEASLKALEQLSMKYVGDSVIQLGGQSVPFNSPNFLQLIQATVIEVAICNRPNFTICFTKDGFLCIVDVDIFKLGPGSAGSDTAFLPSLEDSKFSMAMQMIKEIFTAKIPYGYEIVPVTYSKDVIIQGTVEDILRRSDVTMAMSAFPLPLDTGTQTRHTGAVLYDGIVMVKSRRTTKLALFHIFDSLSGFIWLCVFASLIFVAIIFFTIKVVYDRQTRSMGIIPEDDNVPLFKRFLTVIFQNFSAVLLAKMMVKPKLTSLRVLYQSYWMASILIVATYAASLAEQRFVERDTTVPFNSLHGLVNNTANYRWIFLRNSSVVWMMQHSQDKTLNGLLDKAEHEWPQEMYADSVSEVAARIKDNDHLILISSRLEAKQILSEECGLMKVASVSGKSGPVEYLYALGYFLSGEDDFANLMTERIDAASTEQTFNAIEARTLGMGDCPLSSEKINMQHNPFSLRELGGLFIIVLVGIIIAFIVAGIEFVVEKYPMYRQWKKDNGIQFGETYASEVLDIRDNGIWIRLLEKDATAFVDASRIKTTRGRRTERMLARREACAPMSDGRPHLEMGSFVKATYMGNDPQTADPIFSVTEERVFKPEQGDVVPPNNQPTE